MQKPIAVLIVGLGLVGQDAARAVLGCAGMRLVAVVDRDPSKVGQDLGHVLGDSRTLGITVLDDVVRALEAVRPDIALHLVSTSLEEAAEEIAPIIAAGVDIVSSNEELGNAYAVKPSVAAELEQDAIARGVTVLGTGFTPGFTSDYLILAATAICRDVRKVRYERVSNSRPYLGSIVAKHFGLGFTREEFHEGVAKGHVLGHIGFIESARTIADRLGWQIDRIERRVTPTYAADGQTVEATTTSVRVEIDGEDRIFLDLVSSIADDVEGGDRFWVEAVPPLDIVMRPQVSSVHATANIMVNAIPHVINAPPGLMTPGDLPLIHAIEGDARLLLR